MAAEARSSAGGDRRVLVVTLILFGGVTGIVFGRVFLGTHPAFRLAAIGMLAVLIAALLARRHLALSLLASGVGLLFALGIFVFPGTTWAGLPTPDTLRALVRALKVVTEQAATEIAPAPPLPSLMTAGAMAVWSAATATHALSIRSGSSVLPILPGAALLAFAGVVTEDPPRPGYVMLFLAAAISVLFAESMQRTSSWGSGSVRSRTVFSGRWARVLGTAATLSAIAIPGILPGFGGKGLIDVDGEAQRVGVNPIVDIRPSLLQNPPAELFSVKANRPSYWRLAVLDRFNGTTWSIAPTDESLGVPLSVGTQRLIGFDLPEGSFTLTQEVDIEQLGTAWLPLAPDPVQLTLEDDLGARLDPTTSMVELEADTSEGMSYTATSSVPRPSLTALDAILPQNPASDPRYTSLPPRLPPRIREVALEFAQGAQSPFDQVLAIQERLREFTYDDTVVAGNGNDAILQFLEVAKRGYCEQFAGTMAVLVRALGYPARVAIGFLPGDLTRSGSYRITTAQVHAWPEVFFGRYGWLAFEPTPTRDNPTANYLVHLPSAPHPDANLARSGRGPESATTFLERKDEFQGVPTDVQPVVPGRAQAEPERPFPWRRLVLVVLMVAAVAFLVATPAKAVGRRLELGRARESRQRVRAAYSWMLDGASDLGLPRRAWETVEEYRARLTDRGAPQDALERISSLAGRAFYSPHRPRQNDGDEAVAAARTILRELRRRAGVVRSLLGALRPRTAAG
ncbi:MAG: transglutaminase TgpA family protein [Actinomycetota bacterium]